MSEKRSAMSTATLTVLFGLGVIALALWAPARIGNTPTPMPTPTASVKWEPIKLGTAIMLADYSGREDWSGCETSGTRPLIVRCPDGYTLEIK